MSRVKRGLPVLIAATLGVLIVSVGLAMGDDDSPRDQSLSAPVVLQQGITADGERWEVRFRTSPKGECVELAVDDGEPYFACGFDIPEHTEIGFSGGLTPGEGNFYLYGLTSARVASVSAESDEPSRTKTVELPRETGRDDLRFFILVRKPVEDVRALVGYDESGKQIQRVALAMP